MIEVPNSMKAPPIYQEGASYEEYKKDIEIWQLLKVASPEEEGPLVYRTLTGRSKEACADLTVDQIGSKNGLKFIKQALDKVHLSDENQRIFLTLDSFEKCKRSPNMTMSAFILSFENLHNKVKAHKITYPNGVLAYRILKAANMSQEHESLVKATVATGNFTYQNVVEQLKKVFSEVPITCSEPPAIKIERTYHASAQVPPDFNTTSQGEGPNDIYEEYDDAEQLP